MNASQLQTSETNPKYWPMESQVHSCTHIAQGIVSETIRENPLDTHN